MANTEKSKSIGREDIGLLKKTFREVVTSLSSVEYIERMKRFISSVEWEILLSSLKETREKIISAIKDSSLKGDVNRDFLIAYLSAIDYFIYLPEEIVKIIEIRKEQEHLDKS